MTTDIEKTDDQEQDKMSVEAVWQKKAANKIQKLFAPSLTADEFWFFFGLGKMLGANPYKREIYAVKYGNSPAQIFLGRDFYRRKAQEQEEYDGHLVDSVYQADDFKVVNGIPEHSYQLKDRGQLVGAYCVVRRKGLSKPFYHFVLLEEYYDGKFDRDGEQRTNNQGKPMGDTLWDKKPDTMIKKVAEAQGIRQAFAGIFEGTYDESERWTEGKQQPKKEKEELITSILDDTDDADDADIIEQHDDQDGKKPDRDVKAMYEKAVADPDLPFNK